MGEVTAPRFRGGDNCGFRDGHHTNCGFRDGAFPFGEDMGTSSVFISLFIFFFCLSVFLSVFISLIYPPYLPNCVDEIGADEILKFSEIS